jgi:hypothetical protein
MLYKQALNQLGQTAATEILHYKDFDRSAPRQFTADWRVMLSEWQPQASCADAQKVAYRENPIWGQACPAVKQDKQTLLHALPAAWIVMMSEDDMLIEHWLPEMVNALQWFDYDRMHYGALFFAQNVILEINQYFKN